MSADRACVLAAQPHDLGAETIDLGLLIAAGFRALGPIRRLAAHVRQGPPPAGPHRKITIARAASGQDHL
jgi:hypothetical protein